MEYDTQCATLYISGSPGTGKTALVNSVLRDLESEVELQVISINCMALANLDELWDRLLEELEDGKQTRGRGKKPRSCEAVRKALSEMQSKWYTRISKSTTSTFY